MVVVFAVMVVVPSGSHADGEEVVVVVAVMVVAGFPYQNGTTGYHQLSFKIT